MGRRCASFRRECVMPVNVLKIQAPDANSAMIRRMSRIDEAMKTSPEFRARR